MGLIDCPDQHRSPVTKIKLHWSTLYHPLTAQMQGTLPITLSCRLAGTTALAGFHLSRAPRERLFAVPLALKTAAAMIWVNSMRQCIPASLMRCIAAAAAPARRGRYVSMYVRHVPKYIRAYREQLLRCQQPPGKQTKVLAVERRQTASHTRSGVVPTALFYYELRYMDTRHPYIPLPTLLHQKIEPSPLAPPSPSPPPHTLGLKPSQFHTRRFP